MDFNEKMKKWLKIGENPPRDESKVQEPAEQEKELFDADNLIDAKVKALEEMRELEKKITHEKQQWMARLKEKEEERISVEAQIELLEKRALAERHKREMELSLTEQEAVKQLERLEKQLESETREWAKRLEEKENELKDENNKRTLVEAQYKLDEERKRQEAEQELQALKMELEAKNRQILEQRAALVQKLRQQDETNVQLKTQLSLRETQIKSEWEEREQEITRAQTQLQNRHKELEKELSSKMKSWQQQIHFKDVEIGSIKTAVEQKKMSLDRQREEMERRLSAERDKARDRIDLLKKGMAQENEKWAAVLKSREEEFNQLKMKLMLEEAQEKSDWEKRKAEISEVSRKAKKKIDFLENRINEEEDRYKIELQKRNEEFETLKIRGVLQSQEIEKQWQERLKSHQSDKAKLEIKIEDLKKDIENSKRYWDEQLKLKDMEIAGFKDNLQKSFDVGRLEREEQIAQLVRNKEEYIARVKRLEEEIVEEKVFRDKEIAEKDFRIKEIETALAKEKTAADEKIVQLESDYNKKNKPVFDQLETLQNEISSVQHKAADALKEKDHWKESFQRQVHRQEEIRGAKLDEEKKLIELEKKNLEQRTENLVKQKKEEALRYKNLLEERENQINSLKEKLKLDHEGNKTKTEQLMQSLLDKKSAVEKEVAELRIRLEDERGRFNEHLELKNREKRELEEGLNRRINEFSERQKEIESLWMQEKTEMEQRIKELEDERALGSREWQSKISDKNIQIKEYLDLIEKENQNYSERVKSEQLNFNQSVKPLEQEKANLEDILEQQRSEWESKLRSVDNMVRQMKSEVRLKEEVHSRSIVELNNNIEKEKQNFASRIQQIKQEKTGFVDESRKVFEEKEGLLSSKKEELEQTKFDLKKRLDDLAAEHRNVMDGLRASINELSGELEKTQRRWPEVIEARKSQLKQLQQEISHVEENSRKDEERYKEKLDLMRSEYEAKIEQNQKELDDLKLASEEKIKSCDEKLKALEEEFLSHQETAAKLIDEENRVFSDEKYKLERARDEISQSIKREEARGKGELEFKENQIKEIKDLIGARKKDWENKNARNEEQFENEKNRFIKQVRELTDLIEKDKINAKKNLQEKEKEIYQLNVISDEKLAKLKLTLEERKRDREIFVELLERDLAEQRDFWEKQKDIWAKRIESKSEEAEKLKEEYAVWESGRKNIEEEQKKYFEEEIGKLRENIHVMSVKLEKQKAQAVQQLALKEKEIKDIQDEFDDKEKEMYFNEKAAEKSYLEEKEGLTAEMREVENKLSEMEESRGGRLKEIEAEIHQNRLEMNEKKTRLELELKRNDRNFVKLKHQFEASKKELEKEIAATADKLNFQIKMKEEEISTLKMRINLRRERLVSEWGRREESLKDIIERLKIDLSNLSRQETERKDELARRIAVKEKELMVLKEELAEVMRQLDNSGRKFDGRHDQAIEKHQIDIEKAKLMGSITVKNLEMENKLKEGEIKELNGELDILEKRISSEQAKTKDIYEQAFTKADQLKKDLVREIEASVSKQNLVSPAKRNFEKGVKAYQQGSYEDAVGAFKRTLELDNSFFSVYNYLALSYLHLNLKNEALEFGSRALECDPDNKMLELWLEEIRNL